MALVCAGDDWCVQKLDACGLLDLFALASMRNAVGLSLDHTT